MVIHKAKDDSFKVVLKEPELFIEFLRDFIRLDIFKDITPADIEDITERFVPLFQDSKESDTVKKINLKGDVPLFVITIAEHQSKVSFRTSFKMLQYITLALTEYEKEINKAYTKDKEAEKAEKEADIEITETDIETPEASHLKGFKYPPVLPIVFFDGTGEWTAETNFLNKTELNEVFYKYIPKFEYEVVNLNKYEVSDLVKFGDTLSLVMLIDKIKTADGMSLLSKLPSDYIEKLKVNIPKHLNVMLANVITILLKRINVPNDEIDLIADQIYKRRFNEMFTFIEKYDVQETRRIERERGIAIGEERGREESLRETVLEMRRENFPDEVIARITKLPLEKIKEYTR